MGNNETFSNLPFTNITSGFFIGLAVGYFIKKSIKLVLILFGLFVVILFFLQNQELVHLNSDTLLNGTDKFLELIKLVFSFIKEKLSFLQLSGGAGALTGFFIGLKLG